jgi:hypothetical protein
MDHDRKDAGTSRVRAGRKGRWSVVDAVILLLVVLCVVSAAVRVAYAYIQRDKNSANTQNLYDVTFEIEEVHRDVLASVSPFDALYLYDTGERIGYVGVYQDSEGNTRIALTVVGDSDRDSDSGRYSYSNSNGENGTYSSDWVAATGCMVCVGGVIQDGCLPIDGSDLYLAPGSELTVCTERAMFTVRILTITARES